MRHSASTQLITNEDNSISGILLEHNYCSEHEWGVKELRAAMGGMREAAIEEKKVCDFSRIRVKVKPEDLIWFEEPGMVGMGVDNGIRWIWGRVWNDKDMKRLGLKEGDPFQKGWASSAMGLPVKMTKKNEKDSWVANRQTLSAWDGGSFGIVSRDPGTITFLKDLKEALLKGDAVLHVTTTKNPFKPVSGLVIAIESRVPQEQKDEFKAGHEDLLKLKAAAGKTGIEKKLKAAGKQWYALSPSWMTLKERIVGRDEAGKAIVEPVTSKYPVMFWLNPMDQRNNNSMWCMVEDLEAWIKGEGRIPKKG